MAIGGSAKMFLRRFGGKPTVVGDDPVTVGLKTIAPVWESDGNGGQVRAVRTIIRVETCAVPSIASEQPLEYNGCESYLVVSHQPVPPDDLFTDIVVKAVTS